MNADKTMKLWLLRPVEDLERDDNPWEPQYDKSLGFVIRAETEEQARAIAHNNAGDENDRHVFRARGSVGMAAPWKGAKYSTCVELLPEGPAGVVIEEFHLMNRGNDDERNDD